MKKILKKNLKTVYKKVSLYADESCGYDQLTFFTPGCCK